jgi:hypothetical protein
MAEHKVAGFTEPVRLVTLSTFGSFFVAFELSPTTSKAWIHVSWIDPDALARERLTTQQQNAFRECRMQISLQVLLTMALRMVAMILEE